MLYMHNGLSEEKIRVSLVVLKMDRTEDHHVKWNIAQMRKVNVTYVLSCIQGLGDSRGETTHRYFREEEEERENLVKVHYIHVTMKTMLFFFTINIHQ